MVPSVSMRKPFGSISNKNSYGTRRKTISRHSPRRQGGVSPPLGLLRAEAASLGTDVEKAWADYERIVHNALIPE